MPDVKRIVVGISGASGAPYAVDLCRALGACREVEPHLLVSPTAAQILKAECGLDCPAKAPSRELFGPGAERAVCHSITNLYAPIASGSFRFQAVVVVPCSMGRLGAFASGLVRDLLDRAVEVALKEGRRLILVPRETPLSLVHLENMARLARSGAVILPASPGFYYHSAANPASGEDLIRFITARIMDHLGLPFEHRRWGEKGG